MNFDLRLPIGLMFSLFGAILTVYGLISSPDIYQRALGINVIGLDPNFALKFLVYFLLVVVVGGPGSVIGTLLAALLLGVADIAGKYYVPEIGAFVIYAAMIVLLLLFPHGLLGRSKAR